MHQSKMDKFAEKLRKMLEKTDNTGCPPTPGAPLPPGGPPRPPSSSPSPHGEYRKTSFFSFASEGQKRPMKFPYTYSAKIAQFPYIYYMKNNWIAKYYIFGILLAFPAFLKCHRMANTPNNKRVWAEIRRKEATEHHH